MTETPREYKKRIDDTRAKRRINRDNLLEYLQEYELVDGKYKSETKQKILVNFDKNEKSEKSDELYVKIGKELGNIEKKYKELEDVKNKLKLKKQEYFNLKNQLVKQNVDGIDETTLKLQDQELIKIKEKLKKIEDEIKKMEEEITNREKEISEIEETYGKKEGTEETSQDSENQKEEEGQETETQEEKKEIKENPETLEEYKEKILSERGRIDGIKMSIIDLLEEGIGIDDTMKERMKSEISSTFNEYEAKQEGSLRMKSARYLEDRKGILNEMGYGYNRETKSIGGKTLIKGKRSNGKEYIIWGRQRIGDDLDRIGDIKEIGGKPCFRAEKDRKRCIIWGNGQYSDWYDGLGDPQEIGGKLCFETKIDGKWCIMRGTEQYSDWFDGINNLQEIGGKPCFKVKKEGKRFLMWGKKQYSEGYDQIYRLQEIGGKPAFIAKNEHNGYVMRGKKRYSSDKYSYIRDLEGICGKPLYEAKKYNRDDNCDTFRGETQIFRYKKYEIGGKPCFKIETRGNDYVIRGDKIIGSFRDISGDIIEVGGKPCFEAKREYLRSVMRGSEQIGEWTDVWGLKKIGGKPCFGAKKHGKRNIIMRGNEQIGEGFDYTSNRKEIGGKPCYINVKGLNECIMWGNEQQGGWFDDIGYLQGFRGIPSYTARKSDKYCIMRGNEQVGDWFDKKPTHDEILVYIYEYKIKPQESRKKSTNRDYIDEDKSTTENQGPTLREKREGVILDRYQKKLNRDELLKIISGIETMDSESKKTLKSEVLSDFYTEFKKIISTNEFKDMDKEYRELKKVERQKAKKSAELEKQKEIDTPEMVELDEKLSEIANSAMELENGSRLNIRRLKKVQSERDKLLQRQKKILIDLEKIEEERDELVSIESKHSKKYGEKIERPKIKGVELKKYVGKAEELKQEKTLKGHKEAYMKIISEKEEYMADLLYQIETTDFGISEEKKKDVIEKVKISLEKDLEAFKKGDDILKIAEKTEEWLQENEEIYKEKMEELERKIAEKEKEIQNIEEEDLEGKGIDEIYDIKKQKLKLNKELIKLKEEYEKIKSEWEEKLEKYQGKI